MTQREIAARLVMQEYAAAPNTPNLDAWLKMTTYECWTDAGIIAAALDECEGV